MKTFIVSSLLFVGAVAQANTIDCRANSFNRYDGLKVALELSARNDTQVDYAHLEIDGTYVLGVKNIRGADRSTAKYPNMIGVDLYAKDMVENSESGWLDASYAVRLPRGFSRAPRGAQFKAIITLKAADGGSYNTVYCKVK